MEPKICGSNPGAIRAPSILAYDIETIAPPTDDGSFPPWPTHQPIAVGFAQAQEVNGAWLIDIDALVVGGDVDEAALLRETDLRMSATDVIASYNGRQFDALVLRLAAQPTSPFPLHRILATA